MTRTAQMPGPSAMSRMETPSCMMFSSAHNDVVSQVSVSSLHINHKPISPLRTVATAYHIGDDQRTSKPCTDPFIRGVVLPLLVVWLLPQFLRNPRENRNGSTSWKNSMVDSDGTQEGNMAIDMKWESS